jgi:hypothetical protein
MPIGIKHQRTDNSSLKKSQYCKAKRAGFLNPPAA